MWPIEISHFLISFPILYHLDTKHTNSQVNLIEGAYRNSTILARNLKHHLGSKLGALEVKFEPLPVGKQV
jgi:Cdc6-like AAA superfamily ATPase